MLKPSAYLAASAGVRDFPVPPIHNLSRWAPVRTPHLKVVVLPLEADLLTAPKGTDDGKRFLQLIHALAEWREPINRTRETLPRTNPHPIHVRTAAREVIDGDAGFCKQSRVAKQRAKNQAANAHVLR